jgi:hypothetical protein
MAKIPVTDCPAGPALDAAVAKVMGWERLPVESVDYPTYKWLAPEEGNWYKRTMLEVWSFDISAAWKLTERMGPRHAPSLYQIAKWYCNFLVEGERVEASAETAPLAITRAFLLAHGVTEVEPPDD